MREGRASRTAELNALFRALEHALPAERRLFEDPLARAFLTWPLSLVGQLAALPGFREFAIWYIDRRWPGPRSSVAARRIVVRTRVPARPPTTADHALTLTLRRARAPRRSARGA